MPHNRHTPTVEITELAQHLLDKRELEYGDRWYLEHMVRKKSFTQDQKDKILAIAQKQPWK